MAKKPPAGIVPAVVTPFHADESIDYDSWRKVLNS
jgi:dihydrodipicolinate synthase/N-acetylneuraminate lyase